MNEENRTPIYFDSFVNVDGTLTKTLLPPTSLFALKNAVLNNPKGAIKVRGGFTQLNTNTTTSPVSKLVDTKDANGDSYLLAGMSTKIQKSSGGAWSDVLTGMSTAGWFTHVSYRDGLIVSSDDDAPYWIDGNGWINTTGLQLAKPVSDSITIQRAKTAYGDLDADSSYAYCLVYKSKYGDVSPPSHVIFMGTDGGAGSNNIVTTTATLKAFYLQNLPVPTDARITVKTLYRTEGNGEVLYKLADLAPDVTEYEDTLSDGELDYSDTPVFVRIPSTARHSLIHQDRVWLGKISLIEKFLTWTKIPCKYVGADSTADSGTVYKDVLSGGLNYTFEDKSAINGHAIGLTPLYYYQWMVVWVDKEGQESDPVFTPVIQMGASASDWWVELWGLPTNVRNAGSEADVTFVKRRIYRTYGQASTFSTYDHDYYLLEEQNINSGLLLNDNYVDIKEDLLYSTSGSLVVGRWYLINTLVSGDDFSNVGYVSQGTPFKATGTTPTNWTNGTQVIRLYESLNPNIKWASPTIKDYPSAVAFSRIGRPATFYLEDIRNIYEDDKDEITGLVDDGNGVVVLKTNNLYKIYTTNAPEQWYVRRHFADIGCDDYKSVYQKGDVSFFRHNTKVYMMLSGQAPVDIGEPKKDTLAYYAITKQTTATNDWFLLLANYNSSSQVLLVYDTVMKAWYEFPFSSRGCQAIVTKQFAMTNYSVGDFYTMMNEVTYKYDRSIVYDNYGGNNTYISVTVTLPVLYLKGVQFRLRKTVCDFDRAYTNGQCSFSLYDMDNNDTLLTQHNNTESYNTGTHKIRLSSSTVSSRMFVSLTGYFKQINNIRFELRAKRRGK